MIAVDFFILPLSFVLQLTAAAALHAVSHVGVVNYKAGEYVLWAPDVPHAASNIGVEPRYTLQITGTYY